jgi:hypothetical protein
MTEEEFKSAFGLKSTSKDWKKLQTLMNKKWSESDNFVKSNVLPEDEQEEAEGILQDTILTEVRKGNSDYSDNAQAGGIYIRDTVLPMMQEFLNKYRKIAKTTPKTVEINDEEVDIYWTDIPCYEKMTPEQRQQAEQEIAQKVLNGKALFNAITNAENAEDMPEPSLEGAGDLIWAMKALAQKKNGPYIKSAMIVPEGGKLRTWLDGLGGEDGEVYARSSSHLKEQQKLPGQQARGMDFYSQDSKDGELPAGMNTLLYQQITLPSGKKALYMKMETAAAYGTAKYNWVNGVGGTDSTMPKTRNKRDDDDQHAKEHGDKYMSGKKEMDRELGAKREDVPKEVKKAWDTYLKTVTNKPLKAALKAASGGTFRLNKVLMELERQHDAEALDPDDPNLRAFLDVLEEKTGDITTVSGNDMRFGGEAVLTTGDLA